MPTDPTITQAPLDDQAPTQSVVGPDGATGSGGIPSTVNLSSRPADRYQLGVEIARGGMGVIYLATDTAFGREVAVKVLQEHYPPTSGAARRFADEARITGQLQHPAIPPAHDLGTLSDGRPFLAMKLIKGDTLDELLKHRPDPSVDRGRFLAVFEQVCQAVAYAHAHQVIHRDLKPANVMVGHFGEVQVMDWGLAKVLGSRQGEMDDPLVTASTTEVRSLRDSDATFTQAGSILGTPAFMPPEQALGAVAKVNERSDVFGLGAILAVVLTGQPPFAAGSGETTRIQAAQGKIDECFARLDACGADPELVELCRRCLNPVPEARPADAGEVAKAVAGLRAAADERARRAELDRVKAEGEKVAAELKTAEQRKRRILQAAFGIAFTTLVVLGGTFAWWTVDQKRLKETEERNRQSAAERTVNQAYEDALAKFGRANGAGRDPTLWAEARAAALQADARAAETFAPPDVRDRLRKLLTDIDQMGKNRRLVADLLEIQASMGDALAFDGNQDFAAANARYTRAFQDFGTDLFALTPEQGTELLRSLGSEIRVELAAAIDDWAYVRSFRAAKVTDWSHLLAVTRLLDPDPKRNRIRELTTASDDLSLRAFAVAFDPAGQPVQTVNLVAVCLYRLSQRPEDGNDAPTQFLKKAHPHHPGDFQINHNLAFFLLADKKHAESLPYCAAAIAVRPKSAAAWQDYARALDGLKRSDEAIAAYRRVLALSPRNTSSVFDVARLLKNSGDAAGAAGASKDALRIGHERVRLDPTNATSYQALAYVLERTGDGEGAIGAYREAIRLEPDSRYFHLRLAILLQNKKDDVGAIAEYKELVRLEPNSAALHNTLGILLRYQEDLDGALTEYKEAVRLDPKVMAYHRNLAFALRTKGDLDDSITEYREAVRLDPNSATRLNDLGTVLREKGDLGGAVTTFKEALLLDPKNETALTALPQLERMRSLLSQLPEVVAGRAEPKTPAEACEFARLCTLPIHKRYADAVKIYEKAFAADPKLAGDLEAAHRSGAAMAAIRAGLGMGINPPAAPAARAALRGKALGWLQANLEARRKQTSSVATEKSAAAHALSNWLTGPEFSGMRPGPMRIGVPADEQAAWDDFWANVRATLAEARKPAPPLETAPLPRLQGGGAMRP